MDFYLDLDLFEMGRLSYSSQKSRKGFENRYRLKLDDVGRIKRKL